MIDLSGWRVLAALTVVAVSGVARAWIVAATVRCRIGHRVRRNDAVRYGTADAPFYICKTHD